MPRATGKKSTSSKHAAAVVNPRTMEIEPVDVVDGKVKRKMCHTCGVRLAYAEDGSCGDYHCASYTLLMKKRAADRQVEIANDRAERDAEAEGRQPAPPLASKVKNPTKPLSQPRPTTGNHASGARRQIAAPTQATTQLEDSDAPTDQPATQRTLKFPWKSADGYFRVVRIEEGNEGSDYLMQWVSSAPGSLGRVHVTFTKLEPGSTVTYQTTVQRDGKFTQCGCKGHKGHKHCRHVEALLALSQAGRV